MHSMPHSYWYPLVHFILLTCDPIPNSSPQIRIIYRLVEFSHGTKSNDPIRNHEVYMYVLDALPMALALFVMVVCHPGRTLVGPESEFPKSPTRKEKKAAKKAREAEDLELANAKRIGGWRISLRVEGRVEAPTTFCSRKLLPKSS